VPGRTWTRPRWGPCAAWGSGFPIAVPGPGPPGGARPVASSPVLVGPCCPGPMPLGPPWSSVVSGTAPLAGVISRQARQPVAHGCLTMRPAGSHPLTGAPSGGGTPWTAGSSTPSSRPPRGVRTAAWGRTTSLRGGWRLWSGAAVGGCLVGLGPSTARLTMARPSHWGPPRGVGRLVHLFESPFVPVPGQFKSVPRGGPVGSILCPPACPRALAPGRLPSVPPGCPEGREPPRKVTPALGRPSWIAPPPAGRRATGVPG